MKRVLLLLLLLPLLSVAQSANSVFVLSIDSMTYRTCSLAHHWRFHYGDDPQMAAKEYVDSGWSIIDADIRFTASPKRSSDTFNSIGWFRLHFIADTSVTGIPLALKITQYGASEVYLDGRKIASYGTIHGVDGTVGYDPQSLPLPVFLQATGEHVIAVRYANYNARRNFEKHNQNLAGFEITVSLAKNAISNDRINSIVVPAICALLYGFFIAFCMTHLFLYFFYRASKSNLFFSIFCLCLGSEFIIPLFSTFSSDPGTEIRDTSLALILSCIGCFSFSGFTNYLFAEKKLRFRIVAALCMLIPLALIFNNILTLILCVLMLVFVFVESALITARAIYKKVKGARIIGAGILFFTLFFLSTILFLSLSSKQDINGGTLGGLVYIVLLVAAILCMPVFMSIYLAWSFADVNKSLKKQLEQVELLSARALAQEQEKKQLLEIQKETLEREVAIRTTEVVAQKEEIEQQHNELKAEKKKSDDLLLNILPAEVAEELKENGSSPARLFDHVTVMFTDFVDFTTAGERLSPQDLVNELHTCFKAFDEIISKYGIEKIKTIGDAYLAVCGLPEATGDHAVKMVYAAQEIMRFMAARQKEPGNRTFRIRIGLHTGSVVAGIVGVKKFAYDIWGDTVNTAARLEQHSEAGKINISQTTYDLVKDKFTCTPRGKIQAKNKGELSMYFIEDLIS